MNNIDLFVLKVIEIAGARFEIHQQDVIIDDILLSSSEELQYRTVLRVRRTNNTKGGWRTLLIASMTDKKDLTHVIRWAAECRDLLSEPEASDLYLFIDAQVCNLSLGEATKIESSEQFCRKYVTRPNEDLSTLLKRTFLCQLVGAELPTKISDPLIDALTKTGDEYSWFNENEQSLWQKAFLSGETGSELVDTLFTPEIGVEDL